ncbi:SDR family NAD(P)-dependent oxidoreductase [Pseudacidobacterium ailaaui]|jgi:short-subunit dehydrogenase|uniref:SDR family NAD(P)-dependent oxidoreductase n=1 Tax=Pseudacidobacterium ailaaui TaxID=1382359 RepID=UPI0005D18480|nr:SDR family oxidoreductase [Pseudacidobacterium ailaaui]
MQNEKRLRGVCQGKWALVTGASAGIGLALAKQLAEAGANLVLTARRRDRLEALALGLEKDHGVQTLTIPADLAEPAAPEELLAATEGAGLPVEILVNNAGFGYYGEFVKGDAAWQRTMVEVNCTAVVHLTRLFLPRMMERRRGYIMIVSSTASYQPVPYMSTYAATKVFDRFLAEALAYEACEYGVKVSALCPGPTESEFHEIAGTRNQFGRGRQSAEEVARMGLEGLIDGKHWVIPYRAGRAMVVMERFLPRRWISALAARAFRPEKSS